MYKILKGLIKHFYTVLLLVNIFICILIVAPNFEVDKILKTFLVFGLFCLFEMFMFSLIEFDKEQILVNLSLKFQKELDEKGCLYQIKHGEFHTINQYLSDTCSYTILDIIKEFDVECKEISKSYIRWENFLLQFPMKYVTAENQKILEDASLLYNSAKEFEGYVKYGDYELVMQYKTTIYEKYKEIAEEIENFLKQFANNFCNVNQKLINLQIHPGNEMKVKIKLLLKILEELNEFDSLKSMLKMILDTWVEENEFFLKSKGLDLTLEYITPFFNKELLENKELKEELKKTVSEFEAYLNRILYNAEKEKNEEVLMERIASLKALSQFVKMK